MNKYEILTKMQNLCDTYGVFFELNKDALIIKKYVFHRGQYYHFKRAVESKMFTHPDFDLEDYVLTFEKKLAEKLTELDTKESDKE